MAMSAQRKAWNKAERKDAKHPSVAHCFTVKGDWNSEVEGTLPMGITIIGYVEDVNVALERLGYRKIKVTSNMLNPSAGNFCIDYYTPSYCDPGCESYHTM